MFGVVGRVLPFRWCRSLAVPLAGLFWHLGLRRRVLRKNLAMALPDLSERERERLARRSMVNAATVGLEMLTLRHLSDEELRRVIHVEPIDMLRSIGPRGALLLSGHFGNWELLALGAAALSGVPFNVVVKQQRDYGELTRMRTARGNRLILTSRAARETSQLLGSGGVVAMLADQSAADHDALVSMFGIPTYAFSAPARLALRYRPRVIVGFAERRADGGYDVRLEELQYDDLPDTPEGARELTQRYISRLEAVIRARPEAWLWTHRRWKHTPGVTYD
jgi:KDO2-lipid IV(A) lauroyltransferase